jgi:hypothetical protein
MTSRHLREPSRRYGAELGARLSVELWSLYDHNSTRKARWGVPAQLEQAGRRFERTDLRDLGRLSVPCDRKPAEILGPRWPGAAAAEVPFRGRSLRTTSRCEQEMIPDCHVSIPDD